MPAQAPPSAPRESEEGGRGPTWEQRGLGALYLVAGLLVNPASVGALLAPDGSIERTSSLAMILGLQITLVLAGTWLLLLESTPRGPRLLWRGLGLCLLCAAAAGAFGTKRSIRSGDTERPDLVLVVLDTTRADRMSLHGYGRGTTPRLDELAREALVFDRAYSTSSWTAPAHASLFTGLLPVAHGVTQAAWHLPPELVTLAELLREHGYRTVGAVGNPMLARRLGFDQGFDEYVETWRTPPAPGAGHPAVELLAGALAEREGPLFAFFNLIEPHSPYTSSGPFAREYATESAAGPTANRWRELYTERVSLSATELAHLGDLYDAELRQADSIVGELVELLREHGRLDHTVLVVTADHGENLGEHGHVDHVFNLYETAVRVPLLIRYPAAFPAGQRIAAPVQLHDLFATLGRLAGVEGTVSQGVDLAHGELSDGRPILLSYDYPVQALRALGEHADHPALAPHRRRLMALRDGDAKLIVGSDGRVELYDLAADPGELHDLAPTDQVRVRALRARLARVLAEHARGARTAQPPEGAAADEETRAELEALGYAE